MEDLKNLKSAMLLVLILTMAISCAHYSTTRRPESENVINAPIDVVWEKTLEILPGERMTLKEVHKGKYFIQAKKRITFWSFGDDVSIRLIPKSQNQTIMNFDAGISETFACASEDIDNLSISRKVENQTMLHFDLACMWGAFDFGHEGRMVRSIFDRIKKASEGACQPKGLNKMP